MLHQYAPIRGEIFRDARFRRDNVPVADLDMSGHSDLASDHHVITDAGTPRDPCLPGDDRVLADDRVVPDLHQVVDLRALS